VVIRHSSARTFDEPHPVERLRRLAAAIRTGRAPDHDDREWLADAIDQVLAGEPADAAFGLKARPGQRSWRTCAALAERDRLFREAAARFLGGLSLSEQAHRLSVELSRYHATAWQRERTSDLCPDRHLGTIRELLWRALKANDRVLGDRTLRLVLATS
jgi:hypothetical protein